MSWLQSFGTVVLIGVEGTGSYGAGLTRHLHDEGMRVVEVDRPNRQERRRAGKSDPLDAVEAAAWSPSGCCRWPAPAPARTGSGRSTAPQPHLHRPRGPASRAAGTEHLYLVNKAAGLRPNGRTDVVNATKLARRSLARRERSIDAELAEIDAVLRPLVAATAPDLVTLNGVGPDTAGALIVAAGDNPERLGNEATFAYLCGVSPRDASSGKQLRHRLNRRGTARPTLPCGASWSLGWRRTREGQHYVERRCKEGLTKTEAMRCLKRCVAREVFYYLVPLQVA